MNTYEDIIDKKMFFITGRGRSGTWLLQSILDTHPDICVSPEALFIIHLYEKYRSVKNWTEKRKTIFIDDLLSEEKLVEWWQTSCDTLSGLLAKYPLESHFSALCKAVYYEYACRNDKVNTRLLGDKNPEYSLYIPQLSELYPEAKFIHLVRDPRANFLSYQKVDFDMNSTAALAYRWKLYNRDIVQLQERMPDKILIIHYEKLLTETQTTLEQICAFLEVDFLPELLEFYKFSKNIFSWNHKITQPIDPRKADAWKTEILPQDEATIYRICGQIAEELGYPTSLTPRLRMQDISGWTLGILTSWLEKTLFKLPLRLRATILKAYRKRTKVLS